MGKVKNVIQNIFVAVVRRPRNNLKFALTTPMMESEA
jgi:hypothetical protein